MINIYCLYHSIYEFVFLMNIFGKWSDLPLSRKSNRKKEKSMVSFTHHQHNIICSQTQLDDTVNEQTTICRQLFAGHVVGSRPMKRKKNLHQMIIKNIIIPRVHWIWVGHNHLISNKCKWNCFIKNSHKISRILPERALELHYRGIQFLIIGVTGLIEQKCKKTHRVIILPHIWEAWPLFLPCYKLSYVLTSDWRSKFSLIWWLVIWHWLP